MWNVDLFYFLCLCKYGLKENFLISWTHGMVFSGLIDSFVLIDNCAY
jgi:hypothetical protein